MPGIHWLMVSLCPPFAHFVTFRYSRAVSGRPFDRAPPWRWGSPPPQGSSLGCKLCCLAPSSLNRPHPLHPRAHCDFTAWRLIRNAFAVRERRGDPRVVPGFRCPFLPRMPSSMTRGVRSSYDPERRCRDTSDRPSQLLHPCSTSLQLGSVHARE